MHLRTNTHMTFEINKIQVFIFSPRNTEIKIWNLKKLWASILLFWLLEQTTATDKVEPPSVMAPDQKKKIQIYKKNININSDKDVKIQNTYVKKDYSQWDKIASISK